MNTFLAIFTNIVLFLPFIADCQEVVWSEPFDVVTPPQLPEGWESSRSASTSAPDAKTTTSIPHSAPNAVIFTNAKKPQWILSPSLDCLSYSSIRLEFVDRRSSTFTSDVIVEISNDDGATFAQIGDTLQGNIFDVYGKHSIDVTLVEGAQKIQIRWKIVGNGTGSTATYRLDDITLSSAQRVDVGIKWITNTPRFPQRGESVTISGCIINFGTTAAHDVHIALAYDANGDSIITTDEVVLKKTITGLAALDSSLVEYFFDSPRPQQYRFILMISSNEDANKLNDSLWLDFFVSPSMKSIVINEIMPAPHPTEPEWIELFLTGKDTISFEGFHLESRRKKVSFSGCNFTVKVPLTGYVVVTRDTVSLKNYYGLTEGSFIQIPLPEFFFNNNDGEAVLRDANNRILDSLQYKSSWGSGPGISLERINALDTPDSSNWAGCRDPRGELRGRGIVSAKKKGK